MPVKLPSQPDQAHQVTMATVETARQAVDGGPHYKAINLGQLPSREAIGDVAEGPHITVSERRIPDGKGGTIAVTIHDAIDETELPNGASATTRSTLTQETANPTNVIDSKVRVLYEPEDAYGEANVRVFKGDHALARNMIADTAGAIAAQHTASPPEA